MDMRTDVALAPLTTFRVGGTARRLWIPEGESEVSELLASGGLESPLVLGGGSNLLIDDQAEFADVISAKKADERFESLGDGLFYVGASNSILSVIRNLNELGYGGFEELCCLPAQFGGCVVMNAGIGGKGRQRFSLSDFIVSVRVCYVDDGRIEEIPANQCDYSYRKSAFQRGGCVVLGATILCPLQSKELSSKRIAARRSWVKANQEWGKGCFGSCFSEYTPAILRLCRLLVTSGSSVRVAKNNSNWLINDGEATFRDAKRIIDRCLLAHRIARRPIELEVRVWEKRA